MVSHEHEAVYRACTDLGSIAQWRAPESMTGKVDNVDGATYRMSLTDPRGRAAQGPASSSPLLGRPERSEGPHASHTVRV
jgi:hypothetical protein